MIFSQNGTIRTGNRTGDKEDMMAKKKSNHCGDGSFRERKNGKLEYRISYKDDNGLRQRKSFVGYDEEECLKKAQYFLEKIELRKIGIDMDVTIPELVKKRLKSDFEKNFVGIQGYSRNIGTLTIIEKSVIGNMPIAELTEAHVDVFLRTLTSYSNSVISKVYRLVRMGFDIAMNKEIIKRNIMLSPELRCPKSIKPNKKVRGLDEEEQALFLETINNHTVPKGRNDYKKQLLIELFTGMRMGEINALKVESIDFKKKIIRIRNTVSRGEDYRTFIKDGTKTYNGLRDIPMNKLVEPILQEAVQEMKKNPQGLVFYDHKKKEIITTSQVNNFYKRICAKCGLEDNGQHSLRHTFATRCIEAGVPPVVLKNWLGHKDIHITLDTYADVFDRMTFSAVSKLEEYIGAIEEI